MAATSPEVLIDPSVSPRAGQREHIAALTGLRGFAALVVVAVHASGLTAYPWVGLHGYGPIALFVLSGFLLFQPWSKWMLKRGQRPSIRSFAKKRIFRIFPAYLATLVLVAVVYPPSRPDGVAGWLRSLTLTQTTSPIGLRPGTEHIWSLGTEITWYVALPALGSVAALLVLRWKRRPLTVMALVFAAGLLTTVIWRYHVGVNLTETRDLLTMNYWFPGFMVCFLGGGLIAHLHLMDRFGLTRRRPLQWFADRPWLVLGTTVLTAGIASSQLGGGWGWTPLTLTERSIRFGFNTVFALCLLAGVAFSRASSPLSRFFGHTVMVAIGRWSYGIYLLHLPVRELLRTNIPIPDGPLGFLVWFGLQLAICIPLGAAMYAFVERPALAKSRR